MTTTTKYLLATISLLFSLIKISEAQNRIVLNQNPYLVISNGAYLVVDNPNTNAITTLGTGGNIVSENELNVVKWNINTHSGNYTIPFTTATNVKIPLSVNLVVPGTGASAAIIFSTYETATDSNTVYPSDVTNMNSGCSNSNALYAVDRFWRIDAGSYGTKPTPVINFGYNDAVNEIGGTNTINEHRLQAERFNSGANSWQTPLKLYGVDNAVLNTVSGVSVAPADFYKSWTLIDTNSMYVTRIQNIVLCQGDSMFVQGAFQHGAGTFYDTINAISACDTSLVTHLSFTPTPTISNAGTNQSVCGTTATLAGNTAIIGTGLWTLVSGAGTITTPTSPTSGITALGVGPNVFKWTISNGVCTSSTSTVTITGVATPTSAVAGPNQIRCNNTATLAGNTATIGTGTWTLVSGVGTITTPASPTSGLTGLGFGTNVFQWTIANAPCPSSSSTVTIYTGGPTASIASHVNVNCNSGSTGSAVAIASGGFSNVLTYSWSAGAGTNSTASSLTAGTYVITITDSLACSDTASVIITQPAALTAQIVSAPACGSNNGTAEITNVTGGTASYSYSWSPSGGANSTASGLSSGTYTCTITDVHNCTLTKTTAVVVHPLPTTSISSDTTINFGYSATLLATGGSTYTWAPSATLNCTSCHDPMATPIESTTYCVVIADTNNCQDSICVNVTVNKQCDVVVPKAFSPNGDGANDLECIYGKCVGTVHLVIYDRWGEKIFETTDPSQCWDGTYKGTMLNTAVFVYYLDATLIDGSTVKHKGNISLIR
jgi:gliding motility-associated-like protein